MLLATNWQFAGEHRHGLFAPMALIARGKRVEDRVFHRRFITDLIEHGKICLPPRREGNGQAATYILIDTHVSAYIYVSELEISIVVRSMKKVDRCSDKRVKDKRVLSSFT